MKFKINPKIFEDFDKPLIGVICRRWNWREGDRTKITKETKNAVVVLESIASIPIKKAVEELAELIKKYCGGQISIYYLDKDSQEVDIK